MDTEPQTLADAAFERIFKLIVSGELASGDEVNEATLAQRFSFSRGPVREAVKRLQGVRLVTREPYMRARVVSLSSEDICEIFELREAAEGMACRLAAERMSDGDLRRLAADLDASRKAKRTDGARSRELDVHVRILRSCGNRRIVRLLCEELYHLLRMYRMRSGSTPGRRRQAFEEHWQIVKALQLRDGDLAESLMRSHVARASRTLLAGAEPVPRDAPVRAAAPLAASGGRG